MTGVRLLGVYSIRAARSFVDTLATGLLDHLGPAPETMAEALIFLPTRRAVRSLQDAFLRHSNGRALILPRMVPLGDIEGEDEHLFDPLASSVSLPPAIPELQRQLALATLIEGRSQTLADQPKLSIDHAAKLASELSRLLDQIQTENLTFDSLANLVPEEYAQHWQMTLEFLELVTDQWPERLAELGMMDPAKRRNLAVADQIERWRKKPPSHPVIAAGSTGSVPATADLMALIAELPKGAVILPGLDQNLDAKSWETLEPTHPQYGLKRLLSRLGRDRDGIAEFSPGGLTKDSVARENFLSQALRPAGTTDQWVTGTTIDPIALSGLTRIDCADAAEEASVISLIMRKCLADGPGKTCALVTPDRNLARRVAAALGRWRITVDDSAGRPLRDTPAGTFMRLVLEFATERAAPLPLLALFKHPFALCGQNPAEFRSMTRLLEQRILRGPRPAPGLAGVIAALEEVRGDTATDLLAWIGTVQNLIAPFEKILAGGNVRLDELVRAHIGFAENLAVPHDGSGPLLWAGEDGETAADFIADLLDASDIAGLIPAPRYQALFEELIANQVVRPRYGAHPRLAILGPLEARLQHHDVLILGGLNEGTWPSEPNIDPWMGRHMRSAFGLQPPERQVGLAAHDFVQAGSAGRVYWTRADRVDGSPTVPSRWLARIETVLEVTGETSQLTPDDPWKHWTEALDQPDNNASSLVQPVLPPAPRPPVACRPRKMAVTDIERWMRDPYAIYAKHILRLRALEPIDASPNQADYGTLIHNSLDSLIEDHSQGPFPADALDQLLALGRKAFAPYDAQPSIKAFWWPRFERIAIWFANHETARREIIKKAYTERQGSIVLAGPAGPFTLSARADRIDLTNNATLEIIDYKTGTVPTEKEVAAGYSPQLPLEAAIATAGGFADLPNAPIGALSYWLISGGRVPGEIKNLKADAADLAAQALTGLTDLIAKFDDPETPYLSRPRPEFAPRYSDFEHLARVKEWSGDNGGGAQ